MKLRASATTVLSDFLWFTAPAFHPSFHRCFISGLYTAVMLTNWWHGNSPFPWRSQFKHQSRLRETGVLAHAKPLTPHPSAGAGYPSCDPSSTSVGTELMARSHHSLPVPLALSLLPKVPGRAPWLRAALAAVEMEGEAFAWGSPAALLPVHASTRRWQLQNIKDCFSSPNSLPVVFSPNMSPSASSQAMDVWWHLRHFEKIIRVFASHRKWELPRNNCQDPVLFFPFCTCYFWATSPMQIWFKLTELWRIRFLKHQNKYSWLQRISIYFIRSHR